MQVITTQPLSVDEPNAFTLEDRPEPIPMAHDLLVQVQSVSVNPIDTKMRRVPVRDGESSRILGWDAAGIVVSTGNGVRGFSRGDRVFYAGSVRRSGSNAQFHCVDERLVGRMPETLGFDDAAALPLTTLTAWEALFEHLQIGGAEFGGAADMGAQKCLLIIGGAGGVGSVAIQLARQVPNLTIIATASRPESRQWCLDMGAHQVVDHSRSMREQISDLGQQPPDFILLNTGPDQYFDAIVELMAPFGRICSIVESAQPLDLIKLRGKAGSFSWQAMFTRSNLQTSDMAKQGRILDLAAQWVDQGRLMTTKTTDFGSMTPTNLAAAHRTVETSGMIGKGILHW